MGADGQFGKLSSGLGGQSLSRRDWSGHLPDPWRLRLDQAQQGGAPGGLWSWRPPTRRCIEGPRPGRGLCACKCPPEEPVCGDWF